MTLDYPLSKGILECLFSLFKRSNTALCITRQNQGEKTNVFLEERQVSTPRTSSPRNVRTQTLDLSIVFGSLQLLVRLETESRYTVY